MAYTCTERIPDDVVTYMKSNKMLSKAEEYVKHCLRISFETNKKGTITLQSDNEVLVQFAFDLIVQKYAPKCADQGSGLTIADAGDKTVTWEFHKKNSQILLALYSKELDPLRQNHKVQSSTYTDKNTRLSLTCEIGKVSVVYPEVLRLHRISSKGCIQKIEKKNRTKVAEEFCKCYSTESCRCSYDRDSNMLIVCSEDRNQTDKLFECWKNYPDKKTSEKDVHNKQEKETHMTSSFNQNENVEENLNQDFSHSQQGGAIGGAKRPPRAEEQEPFWESVSHHGENANHIDDRLTSKTRVKEDLVGSGHVEDKKYVFRIRDIKVLVYKMSVAEIRDMDAIVNAANEHMQHSGGIAFYISKAAGKKMVDECDIHIQRYGSLEVSEVFVSGPGNMKCKGIIHAVGPQWHNYARRKERCAEDLHKTVLSCLNTMIQRNWRNIALCAISSGIFGVPKPVCTAMYMKALEDFAVRHQGYEMEVHFIDVVEEMLDLMKRAHQKRLRLGMAEEFTIANSYQRGGKGNFDGRDRPREQKVHSGEGWHEYIPKKSDNFNKNFNSSVKIKTHAPKTKTDQTTTIAEDVSEGICVYDKNKATKRLSCGHLMCLACFIHSKKGCRKCASDKKISSVADESRTPVVQETQECVICMDVMTEPVVLKCSHGFCKGCLKQLEKPVCPVCGLAYGVVTGTQPDGRMFTRLARYSLPGFDNTWTIEILYVFQDGVQKHHHPNPGQPYKGITRNAFLPDNKDGREILELLKKAYSRRLIFTIGDSRTTGMKDQITWNDIHHKTSSRGGQFGYPDPTYLTRVRDELAAKGVTG